MVHNEPLGVSAKDFYLPSAILNKIIKNRVAIVPTLTLTQRRSLNSELMAKRTKGLEYLTPEFVNYWMHQSPVFPAEFLHREDDLGTVTVGKLADLLILDDNPLLDISNTQKIYAVIVNGKYFSKNEIKQMLDAQRKK
jgi:hypothetical protein